MTGQLARAGAPSEPKRFRLFLLMGVINTAFGYGAFATLVWAGMQYSLALLLATLLGAAFNFLTTGWVVFGNRRASRFAQFAVVYAALYCANVLALATLGALGIGPLMGQAGLLLPLAVLSYGLNRRFVFSDD